MLMITLLYEAIFVILRQKHIALIAVDLTIAAILLGCALYCAVPIFKHSSKMIRTKLILIIFLFLLKIGLLPTFAFQESWEALMYFALELPKDEKGLWEQSEEMCMIASVLSLFAADLIWYISTIKINVIRIYK